jgi:hypothetical protein
MRMGEREGEGNLLAESREPVSFWRCWLAASRSRTKRGSAMEARLQTAVSSGEVYSTISVHRLELRMVPRFCWFDLRLQVSLYSMYGFPVSTCRTACDVSQVCASVHLLALYRRYGFPVSTCRSACDVSQVCGEDSFACAVQRYGLPVSTSKDSM